MRLRFSWWSAVLGLLVLVLVAAMFGWIPYVTPTNVFWLAVTVFCVWIIWKYFISDKKS